MYILITMVFLDSINGVMELVYCIFGATNWCIVYLFSDSISFCIAGRVAQSV